MAEQGRRSAKGRRTRAEAAALAARYSAGELTRAEFCRRHGLPVATLAGYLTRWRREQAEAAGSREWIALEVAVDGAAAGSGLLLVLGGGRRLEIGRGIDARTLERLLAVLERSEPGGVLTL